MSVEIKVTADTRKASDDINRLRGLLKKVQDEAIKNNKKAKILDVDIEQSKLTNLNKTVQSLTSKLQRNSQYKLFDAKALEASVTQTDQINKNLSSINNSALRVGNTLKSAFAVATVGVFGSSLLKTAQQFDGLRTRLNVATGSIIRAQKAFSDIQRFAAETKFSVDALTDSYARLANTGSDLLNSNTKVLNGLEAIANAITAVGGGDYEIQRVAEAFARMAAEGRVTYERLEPLTTAGISLQRIAAASGKSWSEWTRVMGEGNLTFDEVYTAFYKLTTTTKEFGGLARKQTNSLSGAFSNLGDSIKNLQDIVVNSTGLKKVIISVVNSITSGIKSITNFIEYDLNRSIRQFRLFMLDLDIALTSGSKSISDFINKAKSLDVKSFLPDLSKYSLNLNDYLPKLNTVQEKIADFGKFVIKVFYNIWDVIVGNSYWPDTIEGIANWANRLYGMASPGIDKFANYAKDVFEDLRNVFSLWQDKISIEIEYIQDVGALQYIKELFEDIVTAVKNLGNSGLEAAAKIIDYSFDSIGKGIKRLSEFSKSASGEVFNQFADAMSKLLGVFIPGLREMPQLAAKLQAALAKMDASKFDVSFKEFKLDVQQKFNAISTRTLEENLAITVENTLALLDKGLANTETFNKGFTSIGETFGRIIRRATTDNLKTTFQEDLQDIIIAAFLVAFNKGFRQIAIATLIFKVAFGEDASFVDGLNSIKKQITDFGNSILKGLGIEGFMPSSGGFIVGLLFGAAALGIASGKMMALVGVVSKELLNFFILKKIFGNDQQAAATPGAQAAGSTMGKAFKIGFSAVAGIAALFIGSHLADAIAESLGVENTFYHLGLTAGAIFLTGWVITASASAFGTWAATVAGPAIIMGLKRLAIAAVFSASMFPAGAAIISAVGTMVAAIAAAFTLPVLLTALGIAAGSSIIYYALFGDKDAKGIEGRVTRFAYWLGDTFKAMTMTLGNIAGTIFDSIINGIKNGFGYIFDRAKDLKNFLFDKSFKQPKAEINPQQRRANGGRISGPGTGRSDSIMARLSNGEFVVNAKATSENLPLLQQINRGMPAFKLGGLVDVDFLRREENGPSGKPITKGYIPKKGSTSGVTIATGLDLGQQNLGSLRDMDISPSLRIKFLPYLGKKGKEAANILARKPLEITAEEARDTEEKTIEKYVEYTQNQFREISKKVKGPSFEGLPKPVRTALFSTVFHKGNITKNEGYSAALASARGDFALAAKVYEDWAKADKKGFGGRRAREAALFRSAIPNNIIDKNNNLPAIKEIEKKKEEIQKQEPKGFLERWFEPLFTSGLFTDKTLNVIDKVTEGQESIIASMINKEMLFGNKPLSIRTGEIQSSITNDIGELYKLDIDPIAILQNVGKPKPTKRRKPKSVAPAKTMVGRIGGLPKYADGTEEPINPQAPDLGLKIGELNGSRYLRNDALFNSLTPDQKLIAHSKELNQALMKELTHNVKVNLNDYFGANEDAITTGSAIAKGALNGAKVDLFGGKLSGRVSKNGVYVKFVKSFADGGQITGPGTGRSDSILARLSNGEFVVNAEATRKNLPLLQSMNSGSIPGFADGTKKPVGKSNAVFAQIDPTRDVQEIEIKGNKIKINLAEFFDVLEDLKKNNKSVAESTGALAEGLKKSAGTLDAGFAKTAIAQNRLRAEALDLVSDPEIFSGLSELASKRVAFKKSNIASNSIQGISNETIGAISSILKEIEPSFKTIEPQVFTKNLVDSLRANQRSTKDIDSLFKEILGLQGRKTQPGRTPEQIESIESQLKTSIDKLQIEIAKITPDFEVARSNEPVFSPQAKTLGKTQSSAFIGDFNTGLSQFLKGEKSGKEFGDILKNQFTSRIVDNFATGITSKLFTESTFSNLFAGSANLGESFGSVLRPAKEIPVNLGESEVIDKLFTGEGIAGLFGGGTKGPVPVTVVPGPASIFKPGASGGLFDGIGDKLKGFGSGLSDFFSKGFSGFGSLFSSFPAFAEGGAIPGNMGSATPVLAHAGEIILNEAQQARVAAAMNNSNQQVVNVNITGDISRQTKSEIYRMLPSIAEGVNSHNREKGLR
jgi:tape measure domain-containing protein